MELAVLFCFVSMNAVYFAFSFFENYHASYVRQVHPEYSESLIYICSIFLEIGLVTMNFLISPLLKCLGLYRVIQLNGILVALTMLLMVYSRNILSLYAVYFMSGATHQLTTFSVIMIITIKYEAFKIRYTGYVFTGSSIAFLLWGGLSKIIVNPNNLKQTEIGMTSEGPQRYFPVEVTRNLPYFCFLYGLANVVVSFATSMLLPLFNDQEGGIDFKSEVITKGEQSVMLDGHSRTLSVREHGDIVDLTVQEAHLLKAFTQVSAQNKLSVRIEQEIDEMHRKASQRKLNSVYSEMVPKDLFELKTTTKSLYGKISGLFCIGGFRSICW